MLLLLFLVFTLRFSLISCKSTVTILQLLLFEFVLCLTLELFILGFALDEQNEYSSSISYGSSLSASSTRSTRAISPTSPSSSCKASPSRFIKWRVWNGVFGWGNFFPLIWKVFFWWWCSPFFFFCWKRYREGRD